MMGGWQRVKQVRELITLRFYLMLFACLSVMSLLMPTTAHALLPELLGRTTDGLEKTLTAPITTLRTLTNRNSPDEAVPSPAPAPTAPSPAPVQRPSTGSTSGSTRQTPQQSNLSSSTAARERGTTPAPLPVNAAAIPSIIATFLKPQSDITFSPYVANLQTGLPVKTLKAPITNQDEVTESEPWSPILRTPQGWQLLGIVWYWWATIVAVIVFKFFYLRKYSSVRWPL